jgi:imidazole glycerol-phosphate synthase subunit HisF
MSPPAPAMRRRQPRPRIIPVLLLLDGLVYKTVRFRNPTYVGDPRIAVKILCEKGADELVLLDIRKTAQAREPDYDLIEEIAGESFMPVAYGGGISRLEHARKVIARGVEKVVLNSAAFEPGLIEAVSSELGASGVVVSIDARKRWLGGYKHVTRNATRATGMAPAEAARIARDRGAGEILITSVERDGTMSGFDAQLVRQVADAVDIPVIACGGAGRIEHFADVIRISGASAAAAGSLFVFQGIHRAVLITFPSDDALRALFAAPA